MTNFPRRRLFSLAGGIAGGVLAAGPADASVTAAPPATIPALRRWTEGTGRYRFTASSRILLSSAQSGDLRATADVLADDLRRVTGLTPRVVVQSAPAPRTGDIVLAVVPPKGELGDEGYELRVGRSLHLCGTKSGVFNGTRTLVQWLRQTRTVAAGTARDWPRYPERGLLVANGPKRFTTTFWQGQIRELSYLKLNLLWIYAGYGMAPVEEMRQIAEFGARYNVRVVPQLNMPDHMAQLLAERPDLQLPGRPQSLDLSNPDAYDFARELTNGVLDDFPATPHWHLGSDEYLLGAQYSDYPQLLAYARQRFGPDAVPQDVHYGFVNDLNQTVRAAGKTMRIWNDGVYTSATVPVDRNVVIEHWTQWDGRKTPQQFLDEGYELHNSNQDYLYYDPGARHPDPARIYDEFHAGLFQGGQTVDASHPALLGAKIHLWTLPDVETEEFESDTMAPALRSLAQVLWGSSKPSPSYASGFGSLVATLGRAPGFPVLRRTVSPVDGASSVWPHRAVQVVFHDPIVASSLELSVSSAGVSVPGQVSYDAATRTATFRPNAPWAYDRTFTVALGAADAAGNRIDPPQQWAFRSAKAPSVGYPASIWPDEEGPAVERYVEGQPLELGVKFRTDVSGRVLGIRFYKSAGDIGQHVGNLWSRTGSRLATATYTSETAAGWQEVRFGTPALIAANTTYVASFNTRNGVYGYNHDFFDGRGVDNGVLHALPSGVDGGNGVFKVGLNVFPDTTYLSTNYWVDVLFDAST